MNTRKEINKEVNKEKILNNKRNRHGLFFNDKKEDKKEEKKDEKKRRRCQK